MAVVWALLAAVSFGASDFLGGFASRRSSALPVVLASQLVALALLALALPLGTGSVTRAATGWGVAAGLAAALAFLAFYRGLVVGRMGVVATAAALMAAAVPVAVGLALGERPGPVAAVGIALALVAVALLAGDLRALRTARVDDPGLLLGLAAGVGYGAFVVLIDRTGPGNPVWPVFAATLAGVLLVGGVAVARRAKLSEVAGAWAPVAGSGVLQASGVVTLLLATRSGLLTLVAVLVALAPAPTMLLARWALAERLSRHQVAGVALALAAVAFITAA